MSLTFDSEGEFIAIEVRLSGPAGYLAADFSLDTGATRSLVSQALVLRLGYDLAEATSFSRFITGSDIVTAPIIKFTRVEALEQEHRNFPVVCHNLPSGAPVDGVLGLDFFRGQKLTIDFRAGLVTLE